MEREKEKNAKLLASYEVKIDLLPGVPCETITLPRPIMEDLNLVDRNSGAFKPGDRLKEVTTDVGAVMLPEGWERGVPLQHKNHDISEFIISHINDRGWPVEFNGAVLRPEVWRDWSIKPPVELEDLTSCDIPTGTYIRTTGSGTWSAILETMLGGVRYSYNGHIAYTRWAELRRACEIDRKDGKGWVKAAKPVKK